MCFRKGAKDEGGRTVELYELTVHEMSDFIKNRKVSAVELVQSVLDRINAIDEKIGSYITVLKKML